MTPIRVGTLLFGAIVLVARLSAAQAVGSIAGTVRDTSDAVLPGVTVEVASPALIEKVRTVVTDGSGSYRVENLRPGVYSVVFSLPGFGGVRREGIELAAGFTAAVNAELRVGTLAETVTVTGASPVVDIQNVTQRTVLTKDVLDKVVQNRSTVGFAAVLLGASVTTRAAGGGQDVAGSGGEYPTAIVIHGSRELDQVHIFDGFHAAPVNVAAAGGVIRTFYPSSMIVQEMTLDTSNAPPSIEVGGIQLTYVPKEGGNRFSVSGVANGTTSSLQSGNLDDALRARQVLTDVKIRKVYDFGLGVGGPIRQDRLWFYGAVRKWGAQNTVAGAYWNLTQGTPFYTPDLSRPAYTSLEPLDVDGRVTWQVTPKQKITSLYMTQPNCLCSYAVNANTAPEAGLYQHYSHQYWHQQTWTYVASNRLLFRAGFSGQSAKVDGKLPEIGNVRAALGTVAPGSLAWQELPRNLSYGNRIGDSVVSFPTTKGHPVTFAGAIGTASVSYVTGSHALSVGFQDHVGHTYGPTSHGPPEYSLPVLLSLTRATPTATPVPFQITEYAGVDVNSRLRANIGIYAQDQWKLRTVTLNLGARFDYLNAGYGAHCKAADLFLPEFCTEGASDLPKWTDVSPRLGAAWDLFGTGRTAVKAALGRYVLNHGVAIATASDPLSALQRTTTRAWTDDGNYYPDCNLANPAANGECGAVVNSTFGTVNRVTSYADSVTRGFGVRPYDWQLQTSVQHELRPGLAATIGYFRTWYGNFQVTDNLSVTPADYDPYCITVPTDSRFPSGVSGSQSCGFYDITAAAQARAPKLLIRPAADFGKQTEVFSGVDASMSWRFGRGGFLAGGVSGGRTVTNQCFVVDSPQQMKNCEVVQGWDSQLQSKVQASYPLPWWGVTVSGTYQDLPGAPQNAGFNFIRAQALTQTTLGRPFTGTSVTISPTAGLFTPYTQFEDRLRQVDLRLSKEIRIGRSRVRGVMDVGNLLNSNAILAVNQSYSPTGWLVPSGVLSPRIVKFGAQFDF